LITLLRISFSRVLHPFLFPLSPCLSLSPPPFSICSVHTFPSQHLFVYPSFIFPYISVLFVYPSFIFPYISVLFSLLLPLRLYITPFSKYSLLHHTQQPGRPRRRGGLTSAPKRARSPSLGPLSSSGLAVSHPFPRSTKKIECPLGTKDVEIKKYEAIHIPIKKYEAIHIPIKKYEAIHIPIKKYKAIHVPGY
jgi:hypothetical protein